MTSSITSIDRVQMVKDFLACPEAGGVQTRKFQEAVVEAILIGDCHFLDGNLTFTRQGVKRAEETGRKFFGDDFVETLMNQKYK